MSYRRENVVSDMVVARWYRAKCTRKVTTRDRGQHNSLPSPPPLLPQFIAVAAADVAVGGGATQLSINIFTDAQENMKLRTVKPGTYMPAVGPRSRRGSVGVMKTIRVGIPRAEYQHSATIPNERIIMHAFIYIYFYTNVQHSLTRGALH